MIKLFKTIYVIPIKKEEMENEEKYIKEHFGRQNPFRVPDGYFDQLTDRVMAQLPSDATEIKLEAPQTKSRFVALRPWLYAAACFSAVAIMGLTYHFRQAPEVQPMTAEAVAVPVVDNSYVDEAADYAMLDNVEIYALLAEN